jgi:ribokinase
MLPRLAQPTDFSLLMVLPDGENSIVSTSACSLAMTNREIEPALKDVGADDVVLLQGNLPLDVTEFALVTARRRGARTIFNPAPFWAGAERLTRHCSLVIANRVEAAALGEAIGQADAAIVTLGADGCVMTDREGRRAFTAEPVSARDTTGCGDVFCGTLAAAVAKGVACDKAITLAQKAAALCAARPGAFAALPTRTELTHLFREAIF